MRSQAVLLLPGIPDLDDLQRFLDPDTAARIAAHVTAIFDDKAPTADLMMQRLREVFTATQQSN
jgi:hypothetical protein